ncbi:MAG: Ribosome hibernation promoting factor [Candidatus Anoxychlamydiales bacterium]|nr:Ribosome hibernation promoting factor [Candidatus Anoxychlamydiales bacterium]
MVDKSKFENEGYTLDITGKNLTITDAIKTHVVEKLSKIEKFTNNILEVVVMLEVQKLAHTASIVMKFLHFRIQVHATTVDLYAAIDGAFQKLTKLIRKYKSKLQDHKAKDVSSIDMRVHVLKPIDELEDINDEIEKANLEEELKKYKIPEVVAKETLPLKMLTQDEAIMKLELSGDHFLIYKEEEDQKLKVIYKRDEDHLGIVEIEK